LHTYCLDTNVLLHSPQSLFSFAENTVLLGLVVLEELDRFKSKSDNLGRNARAVARYLDELRLQGSLLEGVRTESGGIIQIKTCDRDILEHIPVDLSADTVDNKILAVAIANDAILITQDINLRVKASALGVTAQDYRTGKVVVDDLYTGHSEVFVSGEQIAQVYSTGIELEGDYHENECLTLYCNSNPNQSALAIYKNGLVKAIEKLPDAGISKIRPQNREQTFALNLLLDDSIPLVSIIGQAGSGKTLIALAAALAKVGDRTYSRILVSRPVTPLGNQDLGFLPGSIQEKMAPWMIPVFDALDIIFGSTDVRKNKGQKGYEDLLTQDLLQIQPLSYIRGRSIPNQLLIVDEAQNLTPLEVKTILTRAAEGTKVVLLGDISQIDSPYLDSGSNGLSLVVSKFVHSSLSGHITLCKGERSELAQAASELLM
jgi:PhoH-like ATPase